MRRFTNRLDNIHVASPCSANWDEMFGDDRKRFCGMCKLNVYNLSDMTRQDAENLIINSEGRLCVRFFRRTDGTVLTKNCPVGWAAVKQRVSRVATAAFSMIAGLFGGIFAFSFIDNKQNTTIGEMTIEPRYVQGKDEIAPPNVNSVEIMGGITDEEFRRSGKFEKGEMTLGQPIAPVRSAPSLKQIKRK